LRSEQQKALMEPGKPRASLSDATWKRTDVLLHPAHLRRFQNSLEQAHCGH